MYGGVGGIKAEAGRRTGGTTRSQQECSGGIGVFGGGLVDREYEGKAD